MQRYSIIALLLIFSIHAPSAHAVTESEKLLRPLIQSGEINEDEDEVVLLSTPQGMKDFIGISNAAQNFSPVKKGDESFEKGQCLGITQIQMALFQSIKFEPADLLEVTKDDDDAILKKLLLAAEEGKPQVIRGYKSRQDFLKEMQTNFRHPSNALRRAIQTYQKRHGLEVKDGAARIATGPEQITNFDENLKASLETSGKLALELQKKIDNQSPASIALIRNLGDQMVGGTAHAVIVVGYVRKKGQSAPDRFLVVDPNFPQQLKVMKKEDGDKWSYTLPTADGKGVERTSALATVMHTKFSDASAAKLAKVFKKETLSPASEIPRIAGSFHCQSRSSDLDGILNAAQ